MRFILTTEPENTVTLLLVMFVFFNDTATTEIYTLSLHDALPISDELRRQGDLRLRHGAVCHGASGRAVRRVTTAMRPAKPADRKSTRLNSSHANISYAVFCLKKKKIIQK